MATLTETAYYSRRIIKYGAISLVALLMLRAAYLTFINYWKNAHPKGPPPPTVAYGKLPKLKFPARPNLPPIGLKLETISGTLPPLSKQGKIFFMPQAGPNLVAWDNAKAWAKKIGFTREPQETGKYSFRFLTETTPTTTLEVEVLTKNFRLAYDWKNDLQILNGNPPAETQAVTLARSYLQTVGVFTEDLITGPTETIYYKYQSGNLNKALFPSEANFAKVNFFRGDIDNLKVLPPNPADANITVLLSASPDRSKNVVEVKYIRFPISLENYATYPFKDVNFAWSQLANGKGFIASLGNNPDGKVTVRNAYLAYYDSDEPQNFLQPVVAFEGDNGFFAYVQAVSDDWVE